MARVSNRGDPLSRPGDAPDRWQDPYFVSRSDTAVIAPVAKEARVNRRGKRRRVGKLFEAITLDPAQQRLHIVRVDMPAGSHWRSRAADRPPKLVDGSSCGNLAERKL